jgi:hypothetical protein
MNISDDLALELITIEEARKHVSDGLVCYDYTKLTAVNTCPTFGVLRYALHRTETSGARSMAIDAGKACHDYFAAQRIWSLRTQYKDDPAILVKIGLTATKLFGAVRYAEMLSQPQDAPDDITRAITFSLPALYTSGFYDNPSDRRRTMANLEAACISYSSRYLMSEMPVLLQDNLIGVELPFCILFRKRTSKEPLFIYTGRIDGLHYYNNVPHIAENKTASRLDDSWRMMFHISNQVTGYMVAASLMLNAPVTNGFVMGAQIPQPKSFTDGIAFEQVSRNESDFLRWAEWVLFSVSLYTSYVHRPTEAPRFSHSCNRYFSTCQFVPFCTMERQEQTSMIEQMRQDEWDPLAHVGEIADNSTGEL